MFGFSREQMMEMGIQDEDTLTLVYTHECVHRVLQNMNGFEGNVEDLACDYFFGIHAALNVWILHPLRMLWLRLWKVTLT